MPGRQYGAFSPPGTPGTPASTRTFSLPTKPGHKGIASIHSSVVNLANTIIGAGALAFPSAFAAMGLMPGVISCLFSGLTSIFGLYLLSRCAAVVGTAPGDEGKKASFSEVARITFGKGWAMRLFDVSGNESPSVVNILIRRQLAIAIKCFGVSVSYLIICKVGNHSVTRCRTPADEFQTLLPQVCVSIARAAHHTIPADSLLLSPDFWLCVTMLVIVPLSFLRTLDALRFTSQIALLTVV
jgi:amino acid permease